jgi:hypothetical protein
VYLLRQFIGIEADGSARRRWGEDPVSQ